MSEKAQDRMESRSGDQYLTFYLEGEEYALEIVKVQEIKSWNSATPIPCSAPHILGVINLRGAIVPVIDLRRQFGLPAFGDQDIRAVIIIRCETSDQTRTVGLLVDKVSEVYNLERDKIQPCSDISSAIGGDYISGLVQNDDILLITVNLENVIRDALELYDVQTITTGNESDE